MSDSQFQTPSKFDPTKNYRKVKFGEKKPVLETELNELQEIQDYLRAEMYRQQAHSGVIDFGGTYNLYSSTTGVTGQAQAVHSSWFATKQNIIGLTGFNALINGHKIKFGSALSTVLTDIVLPAPPTFGKRDDLVFLEAWFEEIDSTEDSNLIDSRVGVETSRRTKLNWRIRTVAGVDFNKFTGDGFDTVGQQANPVIQPQGANASPLNVPYNWTYSDPYWIYGSFSGQSYRNVIPSSYQGRRVALDDIGLYVAGDGSTTSKTALGTADGYVYAIPLFRVKRRNNAGYREDNLDGARDYYTLTTTYTATPSSVSVGQTGTFTANSTDLVNLKIGDILTTITGSTIQIVGISGSTITFFNVYTASAITTLGTGWALKSERPDGKYSNIIDADDIIDLRHRVFNPISYELEMQKAFDQLLRGQLRTLDTQKMAKNRYGLRKAPNGLAQELSPFTFVGDDGVSRDLVNQLGVSGNGQIINVSSGVTYSGTPMVIQNPTQSGNYYLLVFNVTSTSATSTRNTPYLVDSKGVNPTVYGSQVPNFTSNTGLSFWKVNTTATYDRVGWWAQGTSSAVTVSNFALYQIDQATYNKIGDGVTTGFQTGSDLANKFPYVSSYPNLVENLVPDFKSGQWTMPSQVTVNNPNQMTLNATASWQTSTINVKVAPSQAYVVYMQGNAMMFIDAYDSSGTKIAGMVGTNTYSTPQAFTTPSNADHITIGITNGASTSGTFTCTNLQLEKGSVAHNFVPFGRWYLPNDYANGAIQTKIGEQFLRTRKIISDAQMSDTITETVEALMTPQKHISVTQATVGTWAVGDKFTINSDYGVISGVIDSDTALAHVTVASSASPTQLTVDDVSKLSVGDSIVVVDPWNNVSVARNVSAVDTTNKIITLDGPINTWSVGVGYLVVETTASTSSPVVTCAGIAGTWSGLGTKSATYTITTAPTTPTSDIGIQYSVNYPAGKGIQYVPTNVLNMKVNGEDNNDTGAVSVKANFLGKVSGNTDLVAHTMQWAKQSTLQSPTGTLSGFVDSDYAKVTALDGTTLPIATASSGYQAQQLFSFNLIRSVEDKFGEIPGTTTADKVAWLQSNISEIDFNWYGYGTGPNGNKGYTGFWRADNSTWGTGASTINSTPTLCSTAIKSSNATSTPTNCIDANGFIYYLAYADASDGTTASTIYTDYVELELQLNVAETGYTVLQPANKFPVLSENLLDKNTAFPVDTLAFNGVVDGAYTTNKATLSMDNSFPSDNPYSIKAVCDGVHYWQGLESVRTFHIPTPNNYLTVSALVYLPSSASLRLTFYSGGGSDSVTVEQVYPSGWNLLKATGKVNGNSNYYLRVDTGTHNGTTPVTFYFNHAKVEQGENPNPKWTEGRRKITTLNFLGKVAGSTFENPSAFGRRTASTFGTPSIDGVQFAEGATTNYSNMSTQDGTLYSTTDNATGGYSQNLFEFDLSHFGLSLKELKNALRNLSVSWTGYGVGTQGELAPPSAPTLTTATTGGTVLAGTYYVKATWKNANGESIGSSESSITTTGSTSTITATLPTFPNGATSANIYVGTSAGAETLQGNTTSTTFTLTAPPTTTGATVPTTNTTGVVTNEATIKVWASDSGAWVQWGAQSQGTPATFTGSITSNIGTRVTNDQKVYVLVHSTYPAGTPSASNIYTDYVKLDVTLADYVDYKKTNVVKVRPQTKEVKLFFPAKSYRYVGGGAQEDVVEAFYQYVPYQGQFTSGSTAFKLLKNAQRSLVTTDGTGYGSSATNYTRSSSLAPTTAKLPLDDYDYTFINTPISNAPASNINNPYLYALQNGFDVYINWTDLLEGQTMTLQNDGSATAKRGASLLSNDVAYDFQLFYNALTSAVPHLVVLPLLALNISTNELFLIVGTRSLKDNTNTITSRNTSSRAVAWDFFKLQGRPLIKGVN